jgi:iron complex outermembrane receptor protein
MRRSTLVSCERHSTAGGALSAQIALTIYVIFSAPAFAQTSTGEAENRVLEEIIVIAQKREQNAQKIPVTVTAMNSDAIRESGILTIEKLTELSPSVSFDTAQSFQNSSLKIRGIGTFGNTRSFEGAVGIFVDGVYRPRSGMVLSDLLDIDRIEILRGPQGTLFGKNTVAGAIALQSTRPDPGVMSGEAELRVGNLDLRYFKGSFNTPVGDTAAIRVAGTYNKRDGLFTSPDNGDKYNEIDRYGLKAQFLYLPSENFELTLIADYSRSDANCCWGSAQVVNGPTAPFIELYSAVNGLTFIPAPQAENERIQSMNTSPREIVEDSGLTMTINWEFGDQTLQSITSVRNWEHSQIIADADFVAADLFILSEPTTIKTASQEFNLSIPFGETNDVIVGLYFADEDYKSTRSVQTGSDSDNYLNALISGGAGAVACAPPAVALDCLFPVGVAALLDDGEFTSENYFQDSQSFGAFAHANFDLPRNFRLVAGARYSSEDKSGGVDNLFWYDSAIVRAVLASMGTPDDGTPRNGLDLIGTVYSPSFTDSIRDEEVTGTVSLQYFPNDSVMVFGGYHRGSKAGGVNLFREGVVSNTTTYAPEFAESIEAGVKADYWDNKARTNISIFYTEFTDLQINFFTGLEFRTENTGTASTKGVELENNFQITDELRIDFSVTYLDSTFDEVDDPFLSYLVGRQTPRAPDWASVLALTYQKPISENMDFFVRGLASYVGEHYVGADVPSEEKVSSYVVGDASIGVISVDGGWDLLLWCKNCADTSYRTIYFNTTFQPDSFSAYLNTPRQYGLTLRARF